MISMLENVCDACKWNFYTEEICFANNASISYDASKEWCHLALNYYQVRSTICVDTDSELKTLPH